MDRLLELGAVIGVVLTAGAVVVVAMRRRLTGFGRSQVLWLWWGILLTGTMTMVVLVTGLLVDWPSFSGTGLAGGCLVIPLAYVLGRIRRTSPFADAVLVHSIVLAGLVALVGGTYVLVVVGMGRSPEGDERTVLALSMAAAVVASVLAFPARRWLKEWANQRVYGEYFAPDEALRTFGRRMSRAVPLDELLLQLVETLKKTMQLSAAEVWTGTDGVLNRTVSVPDRPVATIRLGAEELPVLARAHAQGNAWLQVWVPGLLAERPDRAVRSVSVSHLGELLGLIVVERPVDGSPFCDDEDRVLVDLARQVGLALHNVRLDSALQASLEELERRNQELIASRARIVAAADASRRRIERNLHDGAQQHLVALAVRVGLLKTLFATDPVAAAGVLEELRNDVQATLDELRELAHGIYPPLLQARGLREALLTAANRAALPTTVDAECLGRYDIDLEAAVYFCCLEAMQNAGKHAGDGARVCVTVGNNAGALWFEVADDGIGFDVAAHEGGHGFINMGDRLGAFGGELTVTSTHGSGTRVRGTLPVDGKP
jgi:signal transduction histidine kinase